MTVLSMPADAGHATTPAPVPWWNMIWVTWRQHRAMLVSVASVLAAAAVFLIVMGLKIHNSFNALTACHPAAAPLPVGSRCGQLETSFNTGDWPVGNTVLILMNLAPALLGAFTGPAVLARELETGTFRYSWTQGIGRVRWTIAKLVLLAIPVTVMAWAFSQVFAWFFDPFLTTQEMNVLAATVFATRGIAFAAWVLAAFAIGAFLGMLIRRIIPAMAATLGVYLGLDLLTWLVLRKQYPVSLVTSDSSLFSGPATPGSPWMLSTWYAGPGGRPASPSVVSQVLDLFPQNGAPAVQETQAQAFAQHGITQWWRYIPVSRFWPMQLIESGWLLVLSALLIAATVWLVRRGAA